MCSVAAWSSRTRILAGEVAIHRRFVGHSRAKALTNPAGHKSVHELPGTLCNELTWDLPISIAKRTRMVRGRGWQGAEGSSAEVAWHQYRALQHHAEARCHPTALLRTASQPLHLLPAASPTIPRLPACDPSCNPRAILPTKRVAASNPAVEPATLCQYTAGPACAARCCRGVTCKISSA